MFDKILIANRGEIACRIARTARRLGVRTVAVYSDADAAARHVALADEAYRIGPPAAAKSYLAVDRILAAAAASGARAVHPGYGFLAENADFAEACDAAGLVFIGPPPAAIRAMGRKGAAKAIMERAGVPVVPGYHGDDQDAEALRARAAEIGYPLMIKAVAGGGGKGMRRVDGADGFAAALEGARRESMSAFGDDAVLLEKFLATPRHVEVQVFADRHGNAVHLFERDCSLQRRHQKVVEEAPAPGLDDDMRRALGDAAVAAARAIDYVGAGTVEFIVDVSDGLDGAPFYFMEMNTRLQVEHPVTEMITGQDLVEWQLRVAAGEPLPLGQDELAISGHAVEVRVYAENPARGFLPSTGRLAHLRLPAEGPHVRVETGVREGDSVTPYYDPMIAKLIAWSTDRAGALRRLGAALADFQVAGVATNVAFLRLAVGHPAFAAGEIDTGFLERHGADLVPQTSAASDRVLALACLDILVREAEAAEARAASSADPWSPWHRTDGWRLNDEGHQVLRLVDGDTTHDVIVRYRPEGHVLELPGGTVAARAEREADGTLSAEIDGARVSAAVVRQEDEIVVMTGGHNHRLTVCDPLDTGALEDDVTGALVAPLPGKVVEVLVEPGNAVRRGQELVIMEAMKMEHAIAAPADGLVERVNCRAGEQVEEGAELLVFAAGTEE